MSHLAEFENLIRQLTSPDNNTRGAAEKVYNDNKKFPDQMLGSLMQLIRLSQDDTVKDMCAVLLRRVTLKEGADLSLWDRSNPQTHQLVQTELLAALESEKTPRIRNRICDIIADIGAYLVSEGKWPELLPYLFKCTKSAVEEHRISSLWIFGQLTPFISDNLKPYLSVLKGIFFDSLNPAQSLKVRMAGLNASAMFIQSIQDEEDKRLFQDLIPLMIDSLRVILGANQEDEARNAIELFIEIAEIEPSFLRPHIPLVFTAMFTIATTASLEEGTRQLGVEFLVTLAESKPAMVRKLPDYLTRLVPVLLEMMCQLEENPKWNEGEEEDMEDTDADIGEESLDRLALSLRGKSLVPVLFELIRPMINSENWQKRHAALMAISVVGEGCIKFLTPHLASVVQMVLPRFADPHPRVRWAACNTCGQMSSDFGPEFQSKFHSEILPALASVMNDVENPRVQSHAASAIINFCEHATKSILEPYLDALLTKLMQLLQQGKKIVQEQAITAIAAIADCVDKSFIKYYDGIAPFLKSILANATTKEYRVLRGKAMECISLIGVAVGKEKFMHDAKEVMELLAHSQSKLEPDDPQISFMLQAWARLCRCLGQDFVPYLNVVMPPLLYSASLRPDIRVLQDDEIDETDENWQYIPCDGKNIGIKTSLLEEKSTACNMIFCYAEELKAGFYPYVDEVAKLLVPLMKFYYHDGVRTAAVSTMPCLISSVKLYHQQHNSGDTQQILALWNFMFPVLLESVKAEPDVEVLILIINTISECLESLGPNMLTDVQMSQALETVHSLITDFHQRRTTRTERKADLDFDPEEGEVIEEEDAREEDVLAEIGEICGKLVKYHPQLFLAHLNTILPLLVQLLAPTTPKNDKMVALCIFDDICEHAGPAAIPLYNIFMKTMLESASDVDSALRQSAVFGLGICAMNGGEAFAPFAPETLARLSAVVSAPDSRSDENVHATENAVAAIGRLIQHQPQALNQSQVLPLWLSHLPVSEDKVESKTTYTHLCHFIENSSTLLFGAQNENLAKVLSVIAQCLETDLIDQAITQRLVAILRKMPSAFPAPVLTAAFKSLPEAHQAKLHKCTA